MRVIRFACTDARVLLDLGRGTEMEMDIKSFLEGHMSRIGGSGTGTCSSLFLKII